MPDARDWTRAIKFAARDPRRLAGYKSGKEVLYECLTNALFIRG